MSAPGAPSVGIKHDTDDDANEDNAGRRSLLRKTKRHPARDAGCIGHWSASSVIVVAGLDFDNFGGWIFVSTSLNLVLNRGLAICVGPL